MIRVRDISMDPSHSVEQLAYEASRVLKVSASKIKRLVIVRRSVDARKKPDVRIIYSVDVEVSGNENKILKNCGSKRASIAASTYYSVPKTTAKTDKRPVVVGFGPAGMFAALVLALAGLKPLVLERGADVMERKKNVEHFFETGELNTRSNIQFGEGGAGTFSDGKLNTGVNNIRIQWILQQFVNFGARENILYDAKPHVGTDILTTVVQNLRNRIVELGGEVRFNTQVMDILSHNEKLTGLKTDDGQIIDCDSVILAIGHSARDTFAMLHENGIPMEPKPFAMGVRIEHKQSMIDKSQYGCDELPLPPADYKLVRHLEEGTVYTFCMCPGGYVVAAASEQGGIVTNGMSYADRDGENANAALLVSLNPSQFPYDGPLGGMQWQREIEQKAFSLSGSYCAPAQKVGDFMAGIATEYAGNIRPTYRPGVVWCDLNRILPEIITNSIKEALPQLDKNLKGFADPDAVMTAPETRSSSPVRILRDENRQSSICGLYPAGEGAGYAGGIMSAAVDGIQCAESLMAALEGAHG